jgi:hypothetical protein
MVTHRLKTLSDLKRNGYWLKVICRCGHDARLDPMMLIECGLTRLDDVGNRLKCSNCGGRDIDYHACNGPEVWS